MFQHNSMAMNGCGTHKIAKALAVIGGINWGLVGIGNFLGTNLNVVNLVLSGVPAVESIVYILVGIGAIMLLTHKCGTCRTAAPMNGGMGQM